jgi:hypothetical protein
MLTCLMFSLCTRSNLQPTLFLGPHSHDSHLVPHCIVLVAVTRISAALNFIPPLKATQAFQ